MSISKTARDRFEGRQAPTLKQARYLGVPEDYDGNGQAIRKAKGLTDRSANLLRIAQNAMGQASVIGTNILRVWDDPNLMETAKVTRTASLAKSAIDNITREYNPLVESAFEDLKSLRRAVAKTWEPPASAGQAAIDSELRGLLRGMKDGERLAAVRSDPALMAAAARAPGVLSGLTDDFHKTIRHEYASRIDSEAVAKADDLEAAILTAEGALQALAEDMRGLTDFETAENLKAKSSADITG